MGINKDRIDAEKKRIKKAQADLVKKLAKERKIRVRFVNLEFPGSPIEFNYQCVQNYVLHDGVEYDLPVSIIDWLNSRAIPQYKQYDPEEENQKLKTEPTKVEDRIIGVKPRFSVVPVSMAHQLSADEAA